MRAMVLERPSALRRHDVPEPVAGPSEVVVEVSACGVCRTGAAAKGKLVLVP
jgi:D-arabinose 1-dehydrogenase-like Zn-dependent alcohol dehydrogenase